MSRISQDTKPPAQAWGLLSPLLLSQSPAAHGSGTTDILINKSKNRYWSGLCTVQEKTKDGAEGDKDKDKGSPDEPPKLPDKASLLLIGRRTDGERLLDPKSPNVSGLAEPKIEVSGCSDPHVRT